MLNSRQKAFCTTALITAASISPFGVNAGSSVIIDEVQLVNTLHTHLYPSSKSLPSSKEIKTAAVCFINDTQPCNGDQFANTDTGFENSGAGGNPDYDLNDVDRCRKEGYTLTSCPEGFSPEGFCIYNSNYFARCVCPSDYKTCEPPYYGVGEACGDKYASCDCTPCGEGYDYTAIPEGYIADGDACVDCDGTTKYKIKINPCDGFQDCGVMGPDTGAQTCMSGSQIKYDNCKPCPNLGTLSSCPSPFTCTYEECSNRYYKTGCQSGYDWDASAQTCTAQCDSSYQYTCTGTNESPSGTACADKYTACTCSSPYTWKNGACSCDSSYKYTCSGVSRVSGGSGTSCNGKYQSCTCECSSWNSGSCVALDTPCTKGKELGYILYSDMSRSSSLTSGKTPIGVVVCSYAGGGGQAVSLKNLPQVKWGDDGSAPLSLPYITSRTKAIQDISSCANTQKILAAGNSSVYSAAWAAHNYSTAGTKAGDWCLPAAGVFYASLFTDAVKRGLNLAKGDSFPGEVWFSSADAPSYAWLYSFTAECGMNNYKLERPAYVRPVIEF